MSKKKNSENYMSIAQSCESRECRKKFKDQIIKNVSETVTTPHKYFSDKNEIVCLYCGKKTKVK